MHCVRRCCPGLTRRNAHGPEHAQGLLQTDIECQEVPLALNTAKASPSSASVRSFTSPSATTADFSAQSENSRPLAEGSSYNSVGLDQVSDVLVPSSGVELEKFGAVSPAPGSLGDAVAADRGDLHLHAAVDTSNTQRPTENDDVLESLVLASAPELPSAVSPTTADTNGENPSSLSNLVTAEQIRGTGEHSVSLEPKEQLVEKSEVISEPEVEQPMQRLSHSMEAQDLEKPKTPEEPMTPEEPETPEETNTPKDSVEKYTPSPSEPLMQELRAQSDQSVIEAELDVVPSVTVEVEETATPKPPLTTGNGAEVGEVDEVEAVEAKHEGEPEPPIELIQPAESKDSVKEQESKDSVQDQDWPGEPPAEGAVEKEDLVVEEDHTEEEVRGSMMVAEAAGIIVDPHTERERNLLARAISRTDPSDSAAAQRLSFASNVGGWEHVSSSGGMTVHRRSVMGGSPGNTRPLIMWRITRVIKQAAPRTIFDLLMDAKGQTKWNPMLESSVEHGTKYGAVLLQSVFKSVGPVSGREVLEFRAASADLTADTLYIAYTSAGVEEARIPVKSGMVRAHVCLSAYKLTPGTEKNTTDMTFISHVDAGGNIPDWIMKRAGQKGGMDLTDALQKEVDRRRRG